MQQATDTQRAPRELFGRFWPLPGLSVARSSQAEAIVRELFGYAGIEIGGTSVGDIRVHDRRFYERVLRDASIGFGESYMDEWWEADALDVTIDKICRANLKQKILGSWRMRALGVKAALLNLQAKSRSGASVEAHYDIGNDLYTRMLDERMVYTCAYWQDAATLAAAQEAKLDLVCRKLGLRAGMRVLDLGCGWGGFASWSSASRYPKTRSRSVTSCGGRLASSSTSSCGSPIIATLMARSTASCRSG
jgi:cyclopropane-fatty-acyl-phospholipid synthase